MSRRYQSFRRCHFRYFRCQNRRFRRRPRFRLRLKPPSRQRPHCRLRS